MLVHLQKAGEENGVYTPTVQLFMEGAHSMAVVGVSTLREHLVVGARQS